MVGKEEGEGGRVLSRAAVGHEGEDVWPRAGVEIEGGHGVFAERTTLEVLVFGIQKSVEEALVREELREVELYIVAGLVWG